MNIFLRKLLALLVISTCLIDYVYAESTTEPDATADQNKTVVHEAPMAPKQMLEKIKQAMGVTQFLDEKFYDDETLHTFFGEPYTFSPVLVPKELNITVIALDSVVPEDAEYKENSDELSKVVPVFKNGKIYLTALGNDQVIAHFVIAVNGAVDANLIQEVFGKPTSVTDDQNADDDDKTNPLGNSRLNYQTESGDIFKNVIFKTARDGAISEMQIYVGKKQ